MSDFRGILRGTFISNQYHYWKYRARFSPFHCCFGNSTICFRSTFAFQERNSNEYFFRNTLGNVVTLTSLLFLSLTYSQSLGEGLIWEYSCKPVCGETGSSGTHGTPSPGLCLNWKQRWEPCDQVDKSPAQPGPSLGQAETGHCQPRALSHSYSLKGSIYTLSLALRA
ncbi:hypothetical protein HJG60_011332 [Phyllostomus discolor]|uniref:Uncharacterized protein n=1 Tax=Phyllostomus discolor TaxID=89673 RepID=A0A833ZXJ0_9CHIR|nr:hypothetical protein HJG60_011332 [Phyllostomus discolor]